MKTVFFLFNAVPDQSGTATSPHLNYILGSPA
jgi:hypothetical protein